MPNIRQGKKASVTSLTVAANITANFNRLSPAAKGKNDG
jgi:hypothetical protein